MVCKRLTVLQVIPALQGGGAEQYVLMLAAGVVARGHRSLVMSGGGDLVAQLEQHGSEHLRLDIGRKSLASLRLIATIRQILRVYCVDVVHIHSRWPAWLFCIALAWVKRERRPLTVTSVHGLYSVSPYSAIMLCADRVIAVSATVLRYVQSNYPWVRSRRLVQIDNGVAEARFRNGYKPDAQWQQQWYQASPQLRGKFVLLMAGRISAGKGHTDFLQILQLLHKRKLAVHGLIVGQAKHTRITEKLTQQIESKRLTNCVTLLPQRTDIVEIMAMSNVVLSLSHKPEAFGLSVAEALHLGVAVVGYDHGGVSEILQKSFPQGLVAVGDLEQVAAKIAYLMQHPSPRIRCDHFAAQPWLAQCMAVYEEDFNRVQDEQ